MTEEPTWGLCACAVSDDPQHHAHHVESGMVESLASYYCVSLVPRPIAIVSTISVTLKSSRSLVYRAAAG